MSLKHDLNGSEKDINVPKALMNLNYDLNQSRTLVCRVYIKPSTSYESLKCDLNGSYSRLKAV